PSGIPGSTNLIKVHSVGEVLMQGTGIGKHAVIGKAVIAASAAEAAQKLQQGDILVISSLDSSYIPILKKAAALITEEGGITSNGALAALNMGIPVIVGAEKATILLGKDRMITVDPVRGLIYRGSTKVL
ncbi:MAG: PEP-utilizing enzyme, partial [Desulfocucumaceae bacterium]